jgi:hypothetical protein
MALLRLYAMSTFVFVAVVEERESAASQNDGELPVSLRGGWVQETSSAQTLRAANGYTYLLCKAGRRTVTVCAT